MRGSAAVGAGKLLVCHVHMHCVLSLQFEVILKTMSMSTTLLQSSGKPKKLCEAYDR
jgi:hypothetical protein